VLLLKRVVQYFPLEKPTVFRVTRWPCSRDVTIACCQSLSFAPLQLLRLVQAGISHTFSTDLAKLIFSAPCLVSPKIFLCLPHCLGTTAYKITCYEKLLCSSERFCNCMNFWSSSINVVWDLLSSCWCMHCPNGPGLSVCEQECDPSLLLVLD